MIIYVIIAFVAILIGMAISVSAFGTGGKRKKIFQDIYFSVEDVDGIGVLYTKTGEYSAILKMENPVQKYSANIDSYYEFNHLVTALAQTLGEGYAIAGVVAVVGAISVYIAMNNEEQDVKKKIMMVVGACIFLVAAAQALPLFFGL